MKRHVAPALAILVCGFLAPTLISATVTEAAASSCTVPTKVSELPDFVVVGHRNGGLEFPEGSGAGSDALLSTCAVDILDFDLRQLSDGTPALMHDASVDRTTSSTGKVDSYSPSGWSRVLLDPGRWFRAGYAPESVMTAAQLLDRYKGRAVLLVEPKSRSMIDRFASQIKSRHMRDEVILQTNNGVAARMGIHLGLHVHIWQSPSQFRRDSSARLGRWRRAGVEGLEVSAVSSDGEVRRALRSGIPTWGYGINDPARLARFRRLGINGYSSDAPLYTAGLGGRPTRPVCTWTGSVAVTEGSTAVVSLRAVVPAVGYGAPDLRFTVQVNGHSYAGVTDPNGRAKVSVPTGGWAPGSYRSSVFTEAAVLRSSSSLLDDIGALAGTLACSHPGRISVTQ